MRSLRGQSLVSDSLLVIVGLHQHHLDIDVLLQLKFTIGWLWRSTIYHHGLFFFNHNVPIGVWMEAEEHCHKGFIVLPLKVVQWNVVGDVLERALQLAGDLVQSSKAHYRDQIQHKTK
jgi:hypothetical protein